MFSETSQVPPDPCTIEISARNARRVCDSGGTSQTTYRDPNGAEVRSTCGHQSESKQAWPYRHSDEIRLGDTVGMISTVRADFTASRAEFSHAGTRTQRRAVRYNQTRVSIRPGGGVAAIKTQVKCL